jgi:hypothetical protein
MNYDPTTLVENDRTKAAPGTYDFYVEQAEDTTFKSDNEGITLTLQVAALPERDIKVFDRLVFVPKALWKVSQLLASLNGGFDFNSPPETNRLIGKSGKAKFVAGEKGYLEVEEYLPQSANNGPDSRLGEAPF